jgi:hypothetical protein
MGSVKMGVHHKPFPANRRAGFFKIDPHYNHDAVGYLPGQDGEATGIVTSGVEVVDGAGSYDQKETLVVGKDQAVDFAASAGDELGLGVGFG